MRRNVKKQLPLAAGESRFSPVIIFVQLCSEERQFMDHNDTTNATRAEMILQELLRTGEVSVNSLAMRLKVTSATIRRDLTSLERRGLLLRSHGGAVPVEPALYETFRHLSSFSEQERRRETEKRRIGLAAARLVLDGETVAFGAGTTTTQVARSIRHRKGI